MSNQPNSSPLAAFMAKYKISLQKLTELCTGMSISRTTALRLKLNELKPEYTAQILASLARTLPGYLSGLGLKPSEIDAELTPLLNGAYQPMISKRLELSIEAQKHFGLSEDPFSRAPRSREEVFISQEFQRVIDRVIDAIRYQGFVAVVGEIGSGKSTLRSIVEDYVIGQNNLHVVWPRFFDMSSVSPMQIAGSILDDFGYQKLPISATKRGKAVQSVLSRQYKAGTRVAIAFDEAHRLSDSSLSSLKNFLEMNSGGFQRYLGVLLFAQKEPFEMTLGKTQFREILERVTLIEMPTFKDDSVDYLRHRLKIAGGDLGTLFDDEAIEMITDKATTPLQLGNIANEALMISGPQTKAYPKAFKNPKVIGAAIKEILFFENRSQGARLRIA